MTNELESAIRCLVNISKYCKPFSSLRYSQNKTKGEKMYFNLLIHKSDRLNTVDLLLLLEIFFS